jgi:hypothetical protein
VANSRGQFAASLQATLVVLQAIIGVGFVGIVALDPDPNYFLPLVALNGYLLALLGAALVHFRREHAMLMLERGAARPSFEARWLAWLAGHPWLFELLGARPTPESLGLRGSMLLWAGLTTSLLGLIGQNFVR